MLDAKAQPAATFRTADWYKSATRWTQLTLAEDDPVSFDPAFWIDVFKRTQVERDLPQRRRLHRLLSVARCRCTM